MPKISAVVPDELSTALEERARAEDRSASAVVRRALVEHLISPSLTGSRVPTETRTLSSQTGAGGTHSEAEERAVEARARRDNEGKT
jgi:Arc/MetJ-type ribon-helix-helix transcriptional regulator